MMKVPSGLTGPPDDNIPPVLGCVIMTIAFVNVWPSESTADPEIRASRVGKSAMVISEIF